MSLSPCLFVCVWPDFFFPLVKYSNGFFWGAIKPYRDRQTLFPFFVSALLFIMASQPLNPCLRPNSQFPRHMKREQNCPVPCTAYVGIWCAHVSYFALSSFLCGLPIR
ncbi:hypothetical protein QBC42DRAFT_100711 [Cladorrhinum samala]|uniref:Uncharacterized protein n=1 Tax=Cladorrhinum samala TaxID=585594 RepID=A0AAV9HPJ2_9PEZI|nr:hypothetical protein QBC42DRAFT_100711 [Cladorrhinum samala]